MAAVVAATAAAVAGACPSPQPFFVYGVAFFFRATFRPHSTLPLTVRPAWGGLGVLYAVSLMDGRWAAATVVVSQGTAVAGTGTAHVCGVHRALPSCLTCALLNRAASPVVTRTLLGCVDHTHVHTHPTPSSYDSYGGSGGGGYDAYGSGGGGYGGSGGGGYGGAGG
jgi:hypothetical protein